MIAVLKRWFRRKPPVTPTPQPVPETAVAPEAPPADAAFVAEPVAVDVTPEPVATVAFPEGDLGAYLRTMLVSRVEELLHGLAPADRDGDSGALLTALLRNEDLGIRQLPAAAQEALGICNDPLASLQALVPLFMKDPTLTQALLRQANSAYYGTGTPVVGLGDAMQRVGTGGVRSVLLAATVQGLLCRPGGSFAAMVTATWEHMGRTAPYARAIAPAFNANPDEAFALGLLHDVGKLVVFDAATVLRSERRRELRLEPAVIRLLLQRAHEPLGGLAVRMWGLGDPAALAVATHHRSPAPDYRDVLSETVFVAEHADLAAVRGKPLDLQQLWHQGALSGSAVRVGSILAGAQ